MAKPLTNAIKKVSGSNIINILRSSEIDFIKYLGVDYKNAAPAGTESRDGNNNILSLRKLVSQCLTLNVKVKIFQFKKNIFNFLMLVPV